MLAALASFAPGDGHVLLLGYETQVKAWRLFPWEADTTQTYPVLSVLPKTLAVCHLSVSP